jgi:hypothetical protein
LTPSELTKFYDVNPTLISRSAVFYIVYFFIKCVMKKKVLNSKKYDRLLKMDYLAKNELKKEIDSSAEKLSILMPDFVIEKLTNFEISSRHL